MMMLMKSSSGPMTPLSLQHLLQDCQVCPVCLFQGGAGGAFATPSPNQELPFPTFNIRLSPLEYIIGTRHFPLLSKILNKHCVLILIAHTSSALLRGLR